MRSLQRSATVLTTGAVLAGLLVGVNTPASAAPIATVGREEKPATPSKVSAKSGASTAYEKAASSVPLADGSWDATGDPETVALTEKWSATDLGVAVRGSDGAPATTVTVSPDEEAAKESSATGPVFELTLDGAAEPSDSAEPTPQPETATPSAAPSAKSTPSALASALASASPQAAKTATPRPSATPTPTPTSTAPTSTSAQSLTGTEVRVDFSDYAEAIGGGWADRLSLVLVNDCDETDIQCQVPLDTVVDTDKGTATAVIQAPPATKAPAAKGLLSGLAESAEKAQQTSSYAVGSQATVALVAAPNGKSGDYTATPMTPSSTWAGGNQSGDFGWSYPFPTPAGPAGPGPELALSYSSGSVDGRSTGTNPQTSWVGEGFAFDPGFIERRYQTCKYLNEEFPSSNAPSSSYDLCWYNDNLTVSFNGKTNQMVRVGGDVQEWRLKDDDGTRIQRLKDASNRDDNGEHYVLTTTDGTQYWFGRAKGKSGTEPDTKSVSTVGVFGSRADEPCHDEENHTFKGSLCRQGWRWNLDYVVDRHGNTMRYFYAQETNNYGANDNEVVSTYDRASYPVRVEYGTRTGVSGKAPARVRFGVSERCLKSAENDCSELTKDKAKYWYDVPYDQICTSSDSCSDRISPTFFTRKRLTAVTTEVLVGDAYQPVDTWTMNHWFLTTGEIDEEVTSVRAMVPRWIEHTGKAGGDDITLPKTEFSYTLMANRVDATGDGIDDFKRHRINTIKTGTGGEIGVEYAGADCTPSSKPSASSLATHARRCFPVSFQPKFEPDPQREFFHKYPVTKVTESDLATGGITKETSYTYGQGNGWHYEDTGVEREKFRTWNQWRGYGRVRTEVGVGTDKTYSDSLYMRGMNGNKSSSGSGTETVYTTDSLGHSEDIKDLDQYAGFERRTVTRDGISGAIDKVVVNTPWTSASTGSWADVESFLTGTGIQRTTTPIAGGERKTSTFWTYDSRGRVTKVEDAGDTSTAADNQCTTTSYASNTSAWMFDFPAKETTTAGTCGSALSEPDDVIEATRTSYDGGAAGAAPTKGDVTKVESAAGLADGTISYQVDATSTYDAYGRVVSATDAKDQTTTTTFTPATGIATEIETTNPAGQKTKQTISLPWGAPSRETNVAGQHTDYVYDALGRVTQVWGPGRDKASQSPTASFDYRVSTNQPSAVTSRTLNSKGRYAEKTTFYDGLLRERSTQSTAAGIEGGRVITHKVYDARGQLITDAGPYYDSQSPSQTMVIETNEGEISTLRRYSFDRLGRPTKERTVSTNEVLFESTTAYAGDRVKVTPPDGGTPRTTVTDARGRTTSITEHEGATASGPGQVTTYAYTPGGQLATVQNSSGTSWSKEYDVRGRLIRDDDPDKGVTTYTYDSLDRQVTSTDARGVTLWTGYDVLGRKTALRDDDSNGTLRSSWAYDSVQPGQLTSATRHTADGDFVSEVTAYDGAGRATSQRLLVPESEGLLSRAGGYVTGTSYLPDGSVYLVSQPSVTGALPENLTYSYDEVGNPYALGGRSEIVGEVAYAHDGRVLGKVYGSSMGTSAANEAREYEAGTKRLTKRWLSFPQVGASPASKLIDLEYGYDDAGNVTRVDDVAGSGSPWRQCFEYDFLRRLTQAWTTSTTDCAAPTASNMGTTDAYRVSYGFAANGNRTSMSRTTGSGGSAVTKVSGSTFPDPATGDRPHAVEATSVLGGPTESFGYDEVGNLTSRETKTSGQVTAGQQIEWDREGRQKTVTDTKTGKKVQYLYDADGNRLLERDQASGSTTLWVGNTQITLKNGTLSTTRNYSLGGEPVATRTGSTLSWVFGDHHQTPVVSFDVTTRTSTKRRFDPYGLPLSVGGTAWPNDRGFVNQRTDTTTGTTHLGAREYDPGAGRFTSVDPVADFMNPQQLNAYAYGLGNPVTFSDPTGLFIPCEGACTGTPGGPGRPYVPPSSGGGSGGGKGGGGSHRPPGSTTPKPGGNYKPPILAANDTIQKYGAMALGVGYDFFARDAVDGCFRGSTNTFGGCLIGVVFSFPGPTKLGRFGKYLDDAGDFLKKLLPWGKKADPPPKSSTDIAANKAAGDAARDALAKSYPGSRTEVPLQTAAGDRRLDILTAEGIGIESKVGRTSLTAATRKQIEKDGLLMQSGDVQGVEWVFTRSSVTGKVGPTGPLARELDKAGIPWREVP